MHFATVFVIQATAVEIEMQRKECRTPTQQRPPSHRADSARSVEPRARKRLALLASLAILAPRQEARADALDGMGSVFTGIVVLVLGEMAIPDLQYEWGPGTDDAHLTLDWPLALTLGTMGVGDHMALGIELRLEAQYRPGPGTTRGVAGVRMPLYVGNLPPRIGIGDVHPAVYAETGVVFGDEGTGPMYGGGVMFGNPFWSVGGGYRTLDLDRSGRRHTIGLDVQIAVPVHWILDPF